MINLVLTPRQALNKAFLKLKPSRREIDSFKTGLKNLLREIRPDETEEHNKNLISTFLLETWYRDRYSINTKGHSDLVIHNGRNYQDSVGVIIETKHPDNHAEMAGRDNINTKALRELVLYFLDERIGGANNELKHLIVTNGYEWLIFDARDFEKVFAQDRRLRAKYEDFRAGRLSGATTEFFYQEIAAPAIDANLNRLPFTWFDLREAQAALNSSSREARLISLFKVLSPEHLLKLPFINDSNTLDQRFYTELLHIIGLVEVKRGNKKFIERQPPSSRHPGSLLENTITQLASLGKLDRLDRPSRFGDTEEERLFNVGLELTITWINRVLFLKLLEAQLIGYHQGDDKFAFLNLESIRNLDDLNTLFFQVLARLPEERDTSIAGRYGHIPYLNSSLFEVSKMEHACFTVSQLDAEAAMELHPQTVLKNRSGRREKGRRNTLRYLFEFLDAYDFSSEGGENIQEENKTLINASVLGLIFEKINGYRDGSFFTPGFITMYMCRQAIRRAVVRKFNQAWQWQCRDFDELREDLISRIKKSDRPREAVRREANEVLDSLLLCDPAVGSGHFLVSALNEIIAIKAELDILIDQQGQPLNRYQVEIANDELVITDLDGQLFEYRPGNAESQRVQETLFHEKQKIIENCLFGVDVNPNSVKICRLRLWIELLKNAYYKTDGQLETLPNIDINIKCGNSLISRFPLDADIKQALRRSKWNIESYRLAVAAYRNARGREEKRKMEQLIDTIKSDFRSEISLNDPKARKLRRLGGEWKDLTKQTELFELSKKVSLVESVGESRLRQLPQLMK